MRDKLFSIAANIRGCNKTVISLESHCIFIHRISSLAVHCIIKNFSVKLLVSNHDLNCLEIKTIIVMKEVQL